MLTRSITRFLKMFTRVLLLTIRETCNKSQTPYNYGNLQMQQSLKMTVKDTNESSIKISRSERIPHAGCISCYCNIMVFSPFKS